MVPTPEATAALLRPGHHGAFVGEGDDALPAPGGAGGPLGALTLAVKDVFDIAGLRCGAGSPAWRDAQRPAPRHALAVQRLLDAGAACVGRTVTDELTYSLAGINAHYGSPINPAAPERLAGGSSSGSAVAVAAGDADIALGTDCGGSVRLPASYCGLWGMRPTHGRIATNGCFTLAHSFDTVGWFARDGQVLAATFAQLAASAPAADLSQQLQQGVQLLHSPEVTALLDDGIHAAWQALLPALQARGKLHAAGEALDLPGWAEACRTRQAAEIWQQHGPWFKRNGPTLGADVRERFERAALISPDAVARAQQRRVQAVAAMARIFHAPGCLLVLPTVPTAAPARSDSPA
ncbi:MAG: amidase family protein, partial [Comamonas sp.]